MFPRCFTPAFRAIWVQKEELKRSIMGEAKFVPNRLWIKSYQKLNSWCSQVLEGIKECKHGISSSRESTGRGNDPEILLVCSSLELLWRRYSGVLSTVLVSYSKCIALQGSMKEISSISDFSKILQYCLFEDLWFSNSDEWKSSNLYML